MNSKNFFVRENKIFIFRIVLIITKRSSYRNALEILEKKYRISEISTGNFVIFFFKENFDERCNVKN